MLLRRRSSLAVVVVAAVFGLPFRAAVGKASERLPPPPSPIANWEPSLVASSSQGTTIAIRCCEPRDDGISNKEDIYEPLLLILFRRIRNPSCSPSALACETAIGRKIGATTTWLEMNGLRLSHQRPAFVSPSWTRLGAASSSLCVCCMTGFLPDVEYLQRTLEQVADDHYAVYGRSKTLGVMTLIKKLQSLLWEATRYNGGGRPLGVQALLAAINNQQQFVMFTLDPSGGYHSWGGFATAIGRGARQVRKELYEVYQQKAGDDADDKQQQPTPGVQEAVKLALSACHKALPEDGPFYEGILLRPVDKSSAMTVLYVDPDQLQQLQEEVAVKTDS